MGQNLSSRIPCTEETRDRLKELKGEDQRYEDLLRRFIDEFESENGNNGAKA